MTWTTDVDTKLDIGNSHDHSLDLVSLAIELLTIPLGGQNATMYTHTYIHTY